MGAVLYLRVSDDRQTENTSLGTQEEICRAWCSKNHIAVERVFTDGGESAKTANRPEFQRMIRHAVVAKNGVSHVVVFKYSRFARNQEDHAVHAALLRKRGVQLVSATEPLDTALASGRMLEGIYAVFNEYENAIRTENATNGMKARVSAGRWVWVAPTGYLNGPKPGPSLVHDEVRGPLVVKLFELVASGQHSAASAVSEVTALGLRSKSGKKITPETLRGLLTNPLFYGQIYAKKWNVLIDGDFKPLIDKRLFDKVQSVRSGRAPIAVPRVRNNRQFPLRGLVRCSDCGLMVTAATSKGKLKTPFHYYRCHRSAGHMNERAEKIEAAFLQVLVKLQPQPERMQLTETVFRQVWSMRKDSAASDADIAAKHLVKLESQKERILAQMTEGRIAGDDFTRLYDGVRVEIADTQERLWQAQASELDIDTALGYLNYLLWNVDTIWQERDLDGKQRLQVALFPNGLVWKSEGLFEQPKKSDGSLNTSSHSIYTLLSDPLQTESDLVGPEGFEPPTKGL
jgi:site-specific DNA recombinase